MPSKTNGSWELRFAMWKLIQAGKTEDEALEAVLPTKDAARNRTNKNRARMLKSWKSGGLWPISSEELEAHGITAGALSSERAACSEQSETNLLPSECPESSEQWEERVKKIAREVCQEMIQNIPKIQHEESVQIVPSEEDLPPDVTASGRKEDRVWDKLGTTADVLLVRRFSQEAKKRRITTGRLMDVILWRYFDRPMLSYQLPEDERKALEAEVKGRRESAKRTPKKGATSSA